MSSDFSVGLADIDDPQFEQMLVLHLSGMHENSPPDAVFALDKSGLSDPSVSLWAAWTEDRQIAAIGALKLLGDGQAEVKSMRTHPDHLRKGAAAAILEAIIAAAKERGVTRLSLETGSGDAFEPALALYRKRGFANGEAFSDYTASEFNQFLHLPLG